MINKFERESTKVVCRYATKIKACQSVLKQSLATARRMHFFCVYLVIRIDEIDLQNVIRSGLDYEWLVAIGCIFNVL